MLGPTLEGDRVRLEAPAREHLPSIAKWRTDLEATRYLLILQFPPSPSLRGRHCAGPLVGRDASGRMEGLATRPLGDNVVTLEPADTTNVDLLVQWTLDPIAQGPHKQAPDMTEDALRILFLANQERRYFLIRRNADEHPLGRFYWR